MDTLNSMATLYVICTLSDGALTQDEATEVMKCLNEYNNVDGDAAMTAVEAACKRVIGKADGIGDLVGECCANLDSLGEEMKSAIVTDLMRISMADEKVAKGEALIVSSVATLLGVKLEA